MDLDGLMPVLGQLAREMREDAADGATPGPVWMPATVQADVAAGGTASVILDPDTLAAVPPVVHATNITGAGLSAQQRVLVLFRPPHGAEVVHALTTARWSTYTPEFSQSAATTPLALTAVSGRYRKVDREASVKFAAVINAAGTIDQPMRITMPFLSAVLPTGTFLDPCGAGHYYDASAATLHNVVFGYLNDDATVSYLRIFKDAGNTNAAGLVGSGLYIAAAAGDWVMGTVTLETRT